MIALYAETDDPVLGVRRGVADALFVPDGSVSRRSGCSRARIWTSSSPVSSLSISLPLLLESSADDDDDISIRKLTLLSKNEIKFKSILKDYWLTWLLNVICESHVHQNPIHWSHNPNPNWYRFLPCIGLVNENFPSRCINMDSSTIISFCRSFNTFS